MDKFIIVAVSENSSIIMGYADSLDLALEKTKTGTRQCMLIANIDDGERNPVLAAIAPVIINGNLTALGRECFK